MLQVNDLDKVDPIGKHELDKKENWLRDLASYVARFCNAKCTFISGTKIIRFWGYKSDCEVAEYLLHVFAREISSRAAAYMSDLTASNPYMRIGSDVSRINEMAPRQKAAIRISFCQSATITLAGRLEKMRENVQTVETTAVVLTRQNQVERWFETNVKYARNSGHVTRWNSAGAAAGNAINIVTGLAASSNQAKLLS